MSRLSDDICCLSESYPSIEPKPFAKPQRSIELLAEDNCLMLTPEKNATSHTDKNSHRLKIKKKVVFKEDSQKYNYDVSDNTLSHPSINSTNYLKAEIVRNKNLQFNLCENLLKETINFSPMKNVINEEISSLLNYRITDKKYKKLTPIEANYDTEAPKVKSLYHAKSRNHGEKPEVMDLWCPNELIVEKHFFNDNTCEPYSEEAGKEDEYETDNYDFLFDIYKYNEFLPFESF